MEAAALLPKEYTPISDARADAAARSIMVKNLMMKFWTETAGEQQIFNATDYEKEATDSEAASQRFATCYRPVGFCE